MTEQTKLRHHTGYILISFGLVSALIGIGSWWVSNSWLGFESTVAVITSTIITFVIVAGLGMLIEGYIARPLLYLSRFINHIASDKPLDDEVIPDNRYGHDLVKAAVRTITDFVRRVEESTNATSSRAQIAINAIEQLSQPFIGLNNQQQIIISNHAARELLGRESLRGEILSEVLPITNERESFLPEWINSAQQSVINATKFWPNTNYSNRDRQKYVFQTHVSFTRNQNEGLETVVLLIDATDEHRADEMKVDFAAMAAHELRAPITVIRGYLDVFETKLRDKFNPQEQVYIDKLKVSADQLNGFISNTLNMSKIDKGELNLHLDRYDWSTVLVNTVNDLQLRAEIFGKQITLSIPDQLPQVLVDPITISEVVTNLVDNAIKYSKTSERIDIAVGVNANGWIETTVTDYGIGIPSNLVDKLFTKYYRSHRSKDNVGGSGIGLYLSKAIVDRHHGQIWAKSVEGQGSTFGFSLPPAEEAEQLMTQSQSTQRAWIQNHSLYRR